MKVREIRDLSPEDVKARIDDTRREIVELRFQMAAHKLESPARLRLARRQLSRLLTIQTETARKGDSAENVKKETKKTEAPKKETVKKAKKQG
jgi:large subunit ribosomal protein L29